jgi:ABC-2 type transport system ATP-binding protein
MNSLSIEVLDISKMFGDKTVLKKINLGIKEGEIFGLLGPSGAGKTTLIKILTGQIKPSEGLANVLGKSIFEYDRKIYTKFGMVLDNTGLYQRMSCYDNLALFTEIYGIPKNRIFEVLNQVGLGNEIKLQVHKLSKGMKQRLILARALLHEPEIIFLDEPTTGLDPSTAKQIHRLIVDEKKKGKTIFLTTHNMEEAHKLCDHVALLFEGNIVEYGEPDEICRKYNYQNKIRILMKSGETLELRNSKESAQKVADCFYQDKVESIHSTEPNLETVFMDLTGRKLEE